jgi:hypothetical protein
MLVLAVAAVAMTACTSPAATSPSAAAPSAPAAVVSSLPPSPVPTPGPTGPAPLVIGFDGVGPFALGAAIDPAAADEAGYLDSPQEACPWVTHLTRAAAPTVLLPDPRASGVIEQVVVVGWVAPSALAANSPRTASGIGIGSTLGELQVAEPDAVPVVGPYGSTQYSIENGAGRWINFGLDDEDVIVNIVVRESSDVDGEYCS